MEQLRMIRNDKKIPDAPDWSGLVCRTFTGSEQDIEAWLDIVQYGLTEKREDKAFFRECMYSHGELEYDKFFIVECGGVPAATLAVICDYEKKQGYIHMVGCKPEFRGLGIGNKLAIQAVITYMSAGMESAYLTTDDFRIPAIKSYLKAGFVPDIINEEHKQRWENVLKNMGGTP
ncbi:MAG: GNAT family N-acetyltransferase [Clostridia bacterium]|nr:GNAT family N-acetyltransferase [Clostridia bacterium]